MDPPELASEPHQSRIELRAAFKSIGLGNVRGSTQGVLRNIMHGLRHKIERTFLETILIMKCY
jgi:hypothetical protein